MISIYELLRRDQDGTSEYVRTILRELNINFEEDAYGNIFSFENGEAAIKPHTFTRYENNLYDFNGHKLTDSNKLVITSNIFKWSNPYIKSNICYFKFIFDVNFYFFPLFRNDIHKKNLHNINLIKKTFFILPKIVFFFKQHDYL